MMHAYDRQQLVKLAYVTGLVKEAAPPVPGLGATAQALGADVKTGVSNFVENVLGRNVAKAKNAIPAAEGAIKDLESSVIADIKAGKPANLKGFGPLAENLEAARIAGSPENIAKAEEATRKARLGAGIAGAAGLAGLTGLGLYRRAAANAAKKKLLMGVGAAGLGGLALGSAMD